MAKELQKNSMNIELAAENGEASKNFDDDGRVKRTGSHSHTNTHTYTRIYIYIDP